MGVANISLKTFLISKEVEQNLKKYVVISIGTNHLMKIGIIQYFSYESFGSLSSSNTCVFGNLFHEISPTDTYLTFLLNIRSRALRAVLYDIMSILR